MNLFLRNIKVRERQNDTMYCTVCQLTKVTDILTPWDIPNENSTPSPTSPATSATYILAPLITVWTSGILDMLRLLLVTSFRWRLLISLNLVSSSAAVFLQISWRDVAPETSTSVSPTCSRTCGSATRRVPYADLYSRFLRFQTMWSCRFINGL